MSFLPNRNNKAVEQPNDKPTKIWCPFQNYQSHADHFGGAGAFNEALFRAALLNERPQVPWDWDDAIANYLVPKYALAWAIANCPKVFTEDEISKLIEITAGAWYGQKSWSAVRK